MREHLVRLARLAILGLAAAGASNGRALAADARAAIAPLPFDHILRYDDLTRLLHDWAAARPDLVALESLGKTPEGREMWFLTLTSRATGVAGDKPAIVVDGNMHATEWGGGVAALHFVHKLLAGYGSDPRVTELLDTRTVYVLPRMTPDGVEATLAQGRFIRSVDRPFPAGPPAPGMHASDVDGDGRSVFMRWRDPNGAWKVSKSDPRLMVPRGPDETKGEFWRVVPEGRITDYDGVTIGDPPASEPLDFGANFPSDLRSSTRSVTAGDYPGSEPEVAAYIAAIAAHPNIVEHVTCHTFGGLVLTPPVNGDEHLPDSDKHVYETLSRRAAELTGYEAMSYYDLRSGDRDTFLPSAFGWLYDRRGILSFITEFWNPLTAAGISLGSTPESTWLFGFHSTDDELKLLRWSDRELHGDGFVRWHEFQHPQLGKVEIGGFDLVRYWYNIPFDRLEREVAPHSEWLVYLGLATPRLAVRSFSAVPAGQDLWRVRLVVENQGYLPTSGSQKAVDQGQSRGVAADLALPEGAHLADGEMHRQLGELAGRVGQRSTATWWGYAPGTPDLAVADWVVAAPAGTKLTVEASHVRAGKARAELVLSASQH